MKRKHLKRLTDSRVASLKPTDKQVDYWDQVSGFGVRVSPGGKKSYVAMYRHAGRLRRWTIGNVAEMDLADAKAAFTAAMAKLKRGIDPGTVKRERRRADAEAPTVADLADEYLEFYAAKYKKDGGAKDRQALNRHVLPKWGRRKASEISRRDVIRLLDQIAQTAPIMANRTLALVRKMYNFGVERDIVQATPCVGIKPPSPEKARERYLTEDEVRVAWQGLAATNSMNPTVKLVLKFMLITGQRGQEVRGARWDEIDGRWWTIPEVRVKNGRTHRVWVSDMALEVLQESSDTFGHPEFVFPSTRAGIKGGNRGKILPIPGDTVSTLTKENQFGIEPQWKPHDMRHTVTTHMGRLGIARFIVDRVINHADLSITAVYDHYSYDKEKRKALRKWCSELQSILRGEKKPETVVKLPVSA